MPGDSDDRTIEALLSGGAPEDGDLALLVPFVEEVRYAVSGNPPAPSGALAAVLAAGLSTEKGDLLATAASNVTGPAPQAAGLPKWRKQQQMPSPAGFLAGLVAKLTGLGTAVKTAVATISAVLTATLAAGGAGVLPAPAQHVVASLVGSVTPLHFPDTGHAAGTVQAALGHLAPSAAGSVESSTEAPAPGGDGNSSAGAQVSTGGTPVANAGGTGTVQTRTHGNAPGTSANVAANATPGNIPALPAPVANIVNNLPSCLKDLVPTTGSVPDPATLAAQIPPCIQQVLGTISLPADVSKCVASVLGSIGGIAGMSAGSLPDISKLDVSSCVPLDLSKCVSNVMGATSATANHSSVGWKMPGFNTAFSWRNGTANGSFSGFSGFSGFKGFTGMGAVPGCVPLDLSKCLSSIRSAIAGLPAAVTAGSLPHFDLSACMPTGTSGGTGSTGGTVSSASIRR
jgi:hypothetical protein